uniref:CRAL-TRIO domain-containing protein n=1 Tax=Eutreptiella gymnastica TaxID=73025 RepID=A0A7S4FIB8_9EUGL
MSLMPKGVVSCILVIDALGVGWAHFDTAMTKQVLGMASVGYRDRVDRIVVGPSGMVVSAAWKFVRGLVSENLKQKFHITSTPAADLQQFIDPKDIPHHVFKA